MRNRKNRKLLIPVFALLLCGAMVLLERYGITGQNVNEPVWQAAADFSEDIEMESTCLILTKENEISTVFEKMTGVVLDGMKVRYDSRDIAEGISRELLDSYETVVLTFQQWGDLGDELVVLFQWVRDGGKLMAAVAPGYDGGFGAVMKKVGIENVGDDYPEIWGFQIRNHCMIGATDDEVFECVPREEEGLGTSLQVQLDPESHVWVASEDGTLPLLWTRDYGKGRVAVINVVITDKYQRGFLCLAYSLLDEVCIYPVIDGSAFYLDDFPSPVPEGDGTYVRRDYGVDTATFYSSIWLPKILDLEEKYGIKHTALIIEEYSDQVRAPFPENVASAQFSNFGNLILNNGGELGFHGYNHMPLCLQGTDDAMQYGEYKLWPSPEDIKASLKELERFSKELFPGNSFCVYVPPSNIISRAGRQALHEACPQIRVIASTYLEDSEAKTYEQEFGMDENGIINTPRITSGCRIDAYQKLTALSELNFHFVQTHFLHPDDVLDQDRGAEEGWEKMSAGLEEYVRWISDSAPQLRNLTGSEMGTAVQQYDRISIIRERTDEGMRVRLGGFSGDAAFLMRVNEGKVTGARGCSYEHVTGDLYTVHTKEEEFVIYLGE